LDCTATVPATNRPSFSCSRTEPPCPTTSVDGFIAFENVIASRFAARSNVAPVTCGPLQSTWKRTSVAGDNVPSLPTIRTRATWHPDCPDSGNWNVYAPAGVAVVFIAIGP